MNPNSIPKNGLLSGMIITAATGLIVLPLGLIYEPFLMLFKASLTPTLMHFFLLSIALMGFHKAESFWFHEYDQCPVYLTLGAGPMAQNPRKAMFFSFVTTLVPMLFMVYLGFMGPPWHLLILTVWIAQGLHELHHSAKSLVRHRIYPGFYTSLLFVATIALGVFPNWYDLIFETRGIFFYGFYAAMPVVFAAFYLEDKSWTSKAPKSIWSPAAGQRQQNLAQTSMSSSQAGYET